MLARASTVLPRKLLKLAYIALIRTHLEYASLILMMVSNTNLNKLEIVQKSAARLITGSPRLAHSAPLLEMLELQSLESRRLSHALKTVNLIIDGNCHPALRDWFRFDEENRLMCSKNCSQ